MSLLLVPVSFDEACGFVDMWHRHHEHPQGHKFSVGVASGDLLVGVAITGRPTSRGRQDGFTLEVTRTCTDGSKNANSMLYAACWRASKAMGYRRLGTYIQEGECGVSLKAAGWHLVAELPPRKGWNMPSRPREDHGRDGIARQLWEVSA